MKKNNLHPAQYLALFNALVYESVNLDKRKWSQIISAFLFYIQNASTHIRNRLLDEAKALLIQTDWTLQDISYSIGFAEQPNFNVFFKKNTGITPAEFRKNYN